MILKVEPAVMSPVINVRLLRVCECVFLTGSSMVARAKQTFSRAKLAPTAEGTGTVEAGPRNSAIYEYRVDPRPREKCGQNMNTTGTRWPHTDGL